MNIDTERLTMQTVIIYAIIFLQPTRRQYRKVFGIATAVCALGGLLFIAFVSGEVQPWNDITKQTTDDSDSDTNSLLGKSNSEINA